ncbi:MAG TPA: RNA polymerase sigma factor [Solirubrobacterales bacterium]|nr:RNA polymerase sigma factor [Solirubrobacterales bacterium]
METDLSLRQPPSSLSRRLALNKVRDGSVGPELVRLIGSDTEIFEAFYRQHVDGVQGFVARRVGDRGRAADLTAEIFLAAIGAAHRYRPERGSPKAWLYGIAQNVVAIDRRRAGREQARDERLRGSALLDEGDAAEIDARIDAAAAQRHLYEAMERLSEPERAVLELVAIDELSLAEAAAAAGVRPVTARVRLHRARRKLRAELDAASTRSNVNEGKGS